MIRLRRWAVMGRLASIALRGSGSGQRLQAETALAGRLKVSRATLRHYRDAYVLSAQLPPQQAWQVRRQASALAASALARWFSREPEAVFAFLGGRDHITDSAVRAASVIRPEESQHAVSRVLSLEDRLRNMSDPDGRLIRLEPRSLLMEVARLGERFSGELGPVHPTVASFYGIRHEAVLEDMMDYSAEPRLVWRAAGHRASAHLAWAGLIEVPSLSVPERYGVEARGVWARAFAASAQYRVVVILSPSAGVRRRLLSSIPPLAAKAWLGHPTDPERLDGRHKISSVPIVAGNGRGLGLILFSTPASLQRDLTMWPGSRWRLPGEDVSNPKGRKRRPSSSSAASPPQAGRWSDGGRWPDGRF